MPLTLPALTGKWVRLEPLTESHREPLRRAADDERIWAHTLTAANGPLFDAWFNTTVTEHEGGSRFAFTVRLPDNDRIVGSTSYLDIHLHHKRIEIGSTWYAPDVWATAVNPECKLLLLSHAFDVVGVNRVALITDLLNTRSQAAIAKLGAVREGVLRSHMLSRGGRVRDSVVFSIVAAAWPAVRAGPLARGRAACRCGPAKPAGGRGCCRASAGLGRSLALPVPWPDPDGWIAAIGPCEGRPRRVASPRGWTASERPPTRPSLCSGA